MPGPSVRRGRHPLLRQVLGVVRLGQPGEEWGGSRWYGLVLIKGPGLSGDGGVDELGEELLVTVTGPGFGMGA